MECKQNSFAVELKRNRFFSVCTQLLSIAIYCGDKNQRMKRGCDYFTRIWKTWMNSIWKTTECCRISRPIIYGCSTNAHFHRWNLNFKKLWRRRSFMANSGLESSFWRTRKFESWNSMNAKFEIVGEFGAVDDRRTQSLSLRFNCNFIQCFCQTNAWIIPGADKTNSFRAYMCLRRSETANVNKLAWRKIK